jgi:ABC-2 type transport system permease protein
MNTLIKSKKKSKNFTLKSYESGTQRKALVKKEIKRLFSDANYIMNSVIGPILGVAGSVVMCVLFKSMGVKNELLFIFPVLFAFAFMVAPPTNCSISLEGNSFWIIKTAPVSIKNLLLNKLLVNGIFGVAPAFIAGLVGTIILGVTWYECVIISLIGASISMLGGAVGLTFDLLFPKMKWESVVEVIKRSTSVFLTMLVAFTYTAVCFLIGYFVPLSAIWNLLIVLSLTVVLVVALHIFIFTKGEKYIAEKT